MKKLSEARAATPDEAAEALPVDKTRLPGYVEQNGWYSYEDEQGQRVVEPKHYPLPTEAALADWEAIIRERASAAFLFDSRAMAGRLQGGGYSGHELPVWQQLAMAVYRCLSIWQQTETTPPVSRLMQLYSQVGGRDAAERLRRTYAIGLVRDPLFFPGPARDPMGEESDVLSIRTAALAELRSYLRDAPDDLKALTLALFVPEAEQEAGTGTHVGVTPEA